MRAAAFSPHPLPFFPAQKKKGGHFFPAQQKKGGTLARARGAREKTHQPSNAIIIVRVWAAGAAFSPHYYFLRT